MRTELQKEIIEGYQALMKSGLKSMEAKRVLMSKHGFRSHNTIAKALRP